MSLWKKNLPARGDSFFALQNEMNDLFENFNRGFFPAAQADGFIPKLEMKEDEKRYYVSAELPGMKEDDIHVTLKDNSLIIEGEKKSEMKKEEKGIYRSEFSYGSFYRSVPLALEVEAEKVAATYKNGILNIEIEKKENAGNARKITIKKD